MGHMDEGTLIQASRAISNLADAPRNRTLLVEAGGIPQLLRSVTCNADQVQEAMAQIIAKVSNHQDIAMELMQAGGIDLVAELLRSSNQQLQLEALSIIANCSVRSGLKEQQASSLLGLLVPLLSSSNLDIAEKSARALNNLSTVEAVRMNVFRLVALERLHGNYSSTSCGRGSPSCGPKSASCTNANCTRPASCQLLLSLMTCMSPISRQVILDTSLCNTESENTTVWRRRRRRPSPLMPTSFKWGIASHPDF